MGMEMTVLTAAAILLAFVAAFHALLHTALEKVEVAEHQAGVLYRQGRYVRTLGPGVYWLVKLWLRERAAVHDMRLTSIAMPSQEVLTKDALPVRLTLIAQYKIADAAKFAHAAAYTASVLYEDLQLALRELVAECTLERARAELAATRVRLNTAKMFRDHPELMRLRELEAMGKAAVLKVKVAPKQ